jgi:hypothetical protein
MLSGLERENVAEYLCSHFGLICLEHDASGYVCFDREADFSSGSTAEGFTVSKVTY